MVTPFSYQIQLVTVSNRQGSPTQWITLSSDNENSAKCHSVTSVEADILSHTKENYKDDGKEDLVRQYDTCDTMTPCDKKPTDIDYSNKTVLKSVEEDDKPSSGPHPRKDEPTPPTAAKKKPAPTDPVRVRFLKEYRTQIPRTDEPNTYDDKLYLIGEIAELQRWKAEDLLNRGIVELVA